jgi:tetratricopeptide (TPR) repeat protein
MSAAALKATLHGKTVEAINAGKLEEARAMGTAALAAARPAAAESPGWNNVLVEALYDMALLEQSEGHVMQSEQYYEEALALAQKLPDHKTLRAKVRLGFGTLLDQSMQNDRAIAVYEECVQDQEDIGENLMAGRLRNNLALHYKQQGRHALAEQHYLRSVELLEAALGRSSEEVASLYNNLGGLYYAAGFPEQAKEMFIEALDVRVPLLGENHPDVSQSTSNLAAVCYELGAHDEAQVHYEKALSILEQHLADPGEVASYEAVTLDYVALLNALQEDAKASAVEQKLRQKLASLA